MVGQRRGLEPDETGRRWMWDANYVTVLLAPLPPLRARHTHTCSHRCIKPHSFSTPPDGVLVWCPCKRERSLRCRSSVVYATSAPRAPKHIPAKPIPCPSNRIYGPPIRCPSSHIMCIMCAVRCALPSPWRFLLYCLPDIAIALCIRHAESTSGSSGQLNSQRGSIKRCVTFAKRHFGVTYPALAASPCTCLSLCCVFCVPVEAQ